MLVERPFEWWAKRAEQGDGDGSCYAGRPDTPMAIHLLPGFYTVSVHGMHWCDYSHGYPWISDLWRAKRYASR